MTQEADIYKQIFQLAISKKLYLNNLFYVKIGLVAFNDKAKKPLSCHGNQLAKATTSNKKNLRDFTKTWTSEGKSNYSAGIEAAFSYFVGSEAEPQRNTRGNCSFKFEKKQFSINTRNMQI